MSKQYRAKDGVETVVVGIRITEKQKEELERLATLEKRTLSNYIKLKLGLL